MATGSDQGNERVRAGVVSQRPAEVVQDIAQVRPARRLQHTGPEKCHQLLVPVSAIQQAVQDGELTIGELAGLEGRLVGYADQFNEVLHPHPLPPELGWDGHPSPKLIISSQGQLEDGGNFSLNVTLFQGEMRAIQIQFD